jgi:hypothetical protein
VSAIDDTGLHPTEGARYLLERDGGDEARAEYAAAIFTPEQRYGYRAVLALDGSFEVSPDPGGAPAELEGKLTMIARLTARSAAKKQADGLPPWPHRVLRWKGPGRG